MNEGDRQKVNNISANLHGYRDPSFTVIEEHTPAEQKLIDLGYCPESLEKSKKYLRALIKNIICDELRT